MPKEKSNPEINQTELLKSIKKNLQIITTVLVLSFLIALYILAKLFGKTGVFTQ